MQNIIKQNLISENNFIIVDEYFFQYMNININDKNKKQVVINIDKNKSLYSITFPIDNKNLNFIELNPGIYQLKENTLNTKESFENKHNTSLLNIVKSKYIIYKITSYMKDKNYLLKLIQYSKYIQEK